MTENEAIEGLEFFQEKLHNGIFGNRTECLNVAIDALKQIHQYRSIGTVEQCREAVEKQKTKIPGITTTAVLEAFKDSRLSLQAKGMLAVLAVLPDGSPQTIESLSKLTPDGTTAVSSSLKELEARGYISRERKGRDGGRLGRTVITLTLKNMEENEK